MSRFIDRLKQASQSEPQPMGFRRAAESEKPRLLLVAEVKADASAGMVEGADAVLLKDTINSKQVKTDLPVGVRLSGSKAGKMEGIDYVILTPEMPVTMARDEKIGKVMAVEASLEMGLLRALENLPLDALFITGEGAQTPAVTWQYLMLCRCLSAISGKPVLAAVAPDISRDELQMLWDAGVSGVVVAGRVAGSFKKLRAIIDDLTLPAKHKSAKARAIVPSLREEAQPAVEEEEEEDE